MVINVGSVPFKQSHGDLVVLQLHRTQLVFILIYPVGQLVEFAVELHNFCLAMS